KPFHAADRLYHSVFLRAFYRWLLYACPPAVRREDGPELEAAFKQSLATEWARSGYIGRLLAASYGLADLLAFAARAHRDGWGRPPIAHDSTPRRPKMLSKMLDTLRSSWRLGRRQPAFSSAIVGMLALGMGAATALFSVVHGVLLTPLPFPEPERLVQ